MAVIISVVNQKGGVGKTTTAVNLGAYLAKRGKFVLLVDLDPQCNATSGLGVDHKSLERGVYETLTGECTMKDVIVPTPIEGYRVAPATANLAGAGVELVSAENREFKLQEALLAVRHEYDYIIIDSPPSLGLLTVNGLVAADQVLIPVQAEYYALEGLGQLMETIGLVKEHVKPDLAVLGAVITMFDGRNRLSNDVLSELHKHFQNRIFRSTVPRNIRLAEAPSFGQSILHYDPGSKGAKAYERLAEELAEAIEHPQPETPASADVPPPPVMPSDIV
jgi:chromosome partitioning protein